jgi:hypothetical protein
MPAIAYLCSRDVLPGDPNRRADAFEQDQQIAALTAGFAPFGLTLHPMAWDDPGTDFSGFAAVLPLATWDYDLRPAAFLQRLEAVAAGGVPVLNPVATVRWNLNKTYLRKLGELGAPILPTFWAEPLNAMTAARQLAIAGAVLESDDLVIKQQIGAGARGQLRLSLSAFRTGEATLAGLNPDVAQMIQAFEPGILSGELSFLFFNGPSEITFSHALLKRAKPGDYRIQSLYGGTESPLAPTPAEIATARGVLGLLSHVPEAEGWLYARVDMVRAADGGLKLMELELVEPFLYPVQGPEVGARLGAALAARL